MNPNIVSEDGIYKRTRSRVGGKMNTITSHGNMNMPRNVEVDRLSTLPDRLSSLPDEILHKILSVINIRDAIRTSVLSSRWRFIWKSMPYLNFSTQEFTTLRKFSKFATNVLSRRDNLIDVYSLKIRFHVNTSFLYVKRILDYAYSHNVQQVNVFYVVESEVEFPLSLFSSQSLKHLSLRSGRDNFYPFKCRFTSTWELPALTTLNLDKVKLYNGKADVFSKCANLKTLKLNKFTTTGSDGFTLFHPRLLNLKLDECFSNKSVVNVVAPQLKILSISSSTVKFLISSYETEHYNISAPGLVSLFYKSTSLHLSTEGFNSLKNADIRVSRPEDADAHRIIDLLQKLHSVKFLKLSQEIVEVLSSFEHLILHQPSPFVNLRSLKIYPEDEYFDAPKGVAMSTKVESYLLDGSPGITFSMVLREEIIAKRFMAKVRSLIEEGNDLLKTNTAHLERGKTPVVSCEQKKVKIEENMAHNMAGEEDPGVQLQQRKENMARFIVLSIHLKLQRVKGLLAMLPSSKSAKLQPCYSSLCAEAEPVVNQLTECMKIDCDEFQSLLSAFTTTVEPSS